MDNTLAAREYLRVSQDDSGRERSTEEQHADHLRAAEREGWTLGEPYAETGAVSASRYSRKARPGFAALVADLERDRFAADILILWEPSRGGRKLSEWVLFLELLEARNVKVYVASHGHLYDLTKYRDRHALQEEGMDAERESAKTSERVKRAMVSNAGRGEPHGRIPFGYRRRYDPVTRRLVAQEIDPDEARVVVEIYRRLYLRHSLNSIAADFAARGIKTRKGAEWKPTMIRDLAYRPLYAGLRAYDPANRAGRYQGPLSAAVKGTWPAIIDLDTYTSVREHMADPARKTARPGKATHLLSMIARCDVCGGELAVFLGKTRTSGQRHAVYRCRPKTCVSIREDDLDAYAVDIMLAYLSQPERASAIVEPASEGELAGVRAALRSARSELAALRDAAKAGKLSIATVVDLEPPLVARVESLEAQERELTTPSELAWLYGPGETVEDRWEAAPMSARRDVARLLCSPAVLGELRVKGCGRGVQAPAYERVTWKREG